MSNEETPRTDAVVGWDDWHYSKNMGELARQLERELATANARVKELEQYVVKLQHDIDAECHTRDQLRIELELTRKCVEECRDTFGSSHPLVIAYDKFKEEHP